MSASVLPASTPWPDWKNPAICLYHGTTLSRAEAICAGGVDISAGSATTDFGRGFYTTTDEANARAWSLRKAERLGESPGLILATISRVALSELHAIVFIRGSLLAEDYWSFVAHCRSGWPHKPATEDFYDVAYGPVAKLWSGNPSSAIWADYDQISFHTPTAQAMLNATGVLEIVP